MRSIRSRAACGVDSMSRRSPFLILCVTRIASSYDENDNMPINGIRSHVGRLFNS